VNAYGVATMSRRLKITGLFCRLSSLLQGSFAKETYNFKEPTNRNHPVYILAFVWESHLNVYMYIRVCVREARERVCIHAYVSTPTYARVCVREPLECVYIHAFV